MRYSVTDVSRLGATTTELRSKDDGLAAYALLRAEPTVVYVQLVEDGKIIRQAARHADSVQNLELEA